MIRNKDFALLYAGRAAFNKNGEYAGVVVGWNDMHGVILGVDHVNGWQSWGTNDIGVSEEEFISYEYRNAGTLVAPKRKTIGELIEEHKGVRGIQFSTDEHGSVQAAYIRGKHGGMGDGLENVSSKIWEEKVWGEKVWKH